MERPLVIGGVALGAGAPRIVATGGEAELAALARAADADLVELRADLFEDPRPETLPAALTALRAAGRPVILTVRAAAEGGRPLPEERRRVLYTAGLGTADALDVEIASAALVTELLPRARAAGKTVILSGHATAAMPARAALLAQVDAGRALGADVVKLAAVARDLGELQTLLEVTLAARDRAIVTLAMGPLGPLSRVVLPAAGSLLTYGHVGQPTAAGQLPLAELAALVRRLFPAG
jgi:3-dehydroquinate dehydratase-1